MPDNKPLKLAHVVRPEIQELISSKDFNSLRDVFKNWSAVDIAHLIMELPDEDEAVIFRILPRNLAAETFDYLDFDSQQNLLNALAHDEVAGILNEMSPDDRTALLEELPAEVTRKLIGLLAPEKRSVAISLLGYPEGSIGRLMTPDYLSIKPTMTVREVLDYIRQHGQDKETLGMIYIVDDTGKLIDDIRTQRFLLAPLDAKVSDLMDKFYVSLFAGDPREKAIEVFQTTDRPALPVTDSDGKIIGIVTIDDVLEVAEERATAEIQKLGGTEALDQPYMETPFWEMIRKRAGWLVILFIGEMFTASAMGYFEHEIARAVVLALFVPLIISSGGNCGSQASTLVIRAMALGEITFRDWWRVMKRELLAGVTLGSILGLIGFTRVTLWSFAFAGVYGPHWFLIALTVCCSLIGVVMWGTLSGAMLPLLLRKLGLDPATSSAPFVATLVDVTGLVIYFTFAAIVLKGTLL
jgi:magnesium transporter